MQYSDQQILFFDRLKTSPRSLLLGAVAGSGKTTTIVHGSSHIPKHVLTVFLAFNKHIATELEAKLPPHIQCGTFHSRCLKGLSRSLPSRPKIDGDKSKNLLKENLPWKEQELYLSFCVRLISLAKNAGVGIPSLCEDSFASWESIAAHHSLTLDSADADLSRAIDIARSCFVEGNSELSSIDFDDMLYLALLKRVNFDKCSFVFVDEAQDTNGVQRELLKLMLAPHGRLIAVGDSKQAIYGFRGADASAMDRIAKEFSCERLALSTCYRCSRSVISEVHRHFPELAPL